MKISPTAWVVTAVFAAILGVGMLSSNGSLTGNATGSSIFPTNGTMLSVAAAVLAIGVLIVAGFQQSKNKII